MYVDTLFCKRYTQSAYGAPVYRLKLVIHNERLSSEHAPQNKRLHLLQYVQTH